MPLTARLAADPLPSGSSTTSAESMLPPAVRTVPEWARRPELFLDPLLEQPPGSSAAPERPSRTAVLSATAVGLTRAERPHAA
jgi:hypothetical protein